VGDFFAWLVAQAARVSRKSDFGIALVYMLRRQDGFLLFLEDGRVDIDSNLVENAIRSPAMNRRNALFAGHDEGGRNWARFASLIGTCKMNGVEPCAYLRDLFTRLAGGHLDKDIDALMPSRSSENCATKPSASAFKAAISMRRAPSRAISVSGSMIELGWRKGMIVGSSVIAVSLLWRFWQTSNTRYDTPHPQIPSPKFMHSSGR
jgi:hypothetical protein